MKEKINISSVDVNYLHISDKSVNKNFNIFSTPTIRDEDLFKKFELLFCKNKLSLNNNYDRNNSQSFLDDKNKFLSKIELDDHIEGEEDENTIIETCNNSQIKKYIHKIQNNISKDNNTNKNSKNKIIDSDNDIKESNHNLSFEGNSGGDPGSLFDTGKADLLCLVLGMSNNNN
jgi:hypothetical protein